MLNNLRPFTKFLLVGCITILLFSLLIGIVIALSIGRIGEYPNLITATRITQEFLENIHDGNLEAAYSMLSEAFSPAVSIDQFAALINEDEIIFSTYKDIEICDWGIYVNNGYVMDTIDLLHYDNKKIVVQISLHKDSDSIWRIQGFYFRKDISPKPFGLCK